MKLTFTKRDVEVVLKPEFNGASWFPKETDDSCDDTPFPLWAPTIEDAMSIKGVSDVRDNEKGEWHMIVWAESLEKLPQVIKRVSEKFKNITNAKYKRYINGPKISTSR